MLRYLFQLNYYSQHFLEREASLTVCEAAAGMLRPDFFVCGLAGGRARFIKTKVVFFFHYGGGFAHVLHIRLALPN